MQKIVRDGIQNEKQIRRIAKIYIAISWTLTVALMVTIFCLSSQVSSKSSGLSSGVISRITELFHITLTQHTVRKPHMRLNMRHFASCFRAVGSRCFKIAAHTFVFVRGTLCFVGRASPIFCVRQSVPAERRTCGLSRCVIRTFGVFIIYTVYTHIHKNKAR